MIPSVTLITFKPGWSDYVAELYSTFRDVAKLWRNAGKPRQGYLFELRRTSKARFKFALRYIKRNEASLRKESLASIVNWPMVIVRDFGN